VTDSLALNGPPFPGLRILSDSHGGPLQNSSGMKSIETPTSRDILVGLLK
jgi:hypothetical protein